MKPIYLSMQAFGPFANLQTINFQELGDNPLFLINGPTGAGKSTILDAMSFALYGESTGKERDPASMRCDLATPDTATEVTFDFSLSGYVYRIKRTPLQQLTKKKGVGTTQKGPTANVYRLKESELNHLVFDESHEAVKLLPLKGVKEVNEWVKELTGLSSEQFRQVTVLPQGQFRKLLLADSDQREQIFSQLFQTSIYKKIEEQLKLQSAELRNNRKSLNENIAGLLDSVDLKAPEELDQQLESVEPKYLLAKKQHDTAQQQAKASMQALQEATELAKKFSELESLNTEISKLKSKGAEIERLSAKIIRADQANKIKPFKTALASAQASLEYETKQKSSLELQFKELDEDFKVKTQKLSGLEPQWQGLDEKKQELDNWQRRKQYLAALIEEQQSQKKLAESLTKVEESIKQRLSKKEQVNKSLAELSNLISTHQEALAEMPRVQANFEKFDRLGRIRRSFADTEELLLGFKSQSQHLADNLKDLMAQRSLDQTNLHKIELSWHQGQAYELAQQLELGKPCMVCGSLEHPLPANASEVTFASKEQLDQARIVLQGTQNQCNAVESELKTTQFKISDSEKKLSDLQVDLGEYVEQPIEWFRDQWKQCQKNLNELTNIQQTQQAKLREQQQSSEQIQDIDKQVAELVENRDAINVDLSACMARIHEREQEVPAEYRNEKAIDSKIIEITAFIEKTNRDYQQCVQQQKETQQKVTAIESLLGNVVERITQQNTAVQSAQSKWQDSLTKAGFESELDFNNFCMTEAELTKQQQLVDDHNSKVSHVKSRISYIEAELNAKEAPKLDWLTEQVELAEAKQKESAEQLTALSNEFEFLKKVSTRLAKINKQVEIIEQEYKVIGTLADVASGQTGSRVSLQRYVLGVLLDDVLNEASQRLQLMSKGRYQLIRKLDRSKGNKTSGLELEIEDAYSGARRPANTLSGGESFMAALSLALGLSDVVQSYSGGIKLDTLFIDEGFGSLDMESLDLAIQTLIDLRKSGRTIGIISHVSELKEQMSQRIDVTSSDQGSSIQIVAAH